MISPAENRTAAAEKPAAKRKKDPHQLTCPECGSTSISVQIVEAGIENVKQGIGVMGHVNNMARGVTALGTLGMSNIVWKKSKPKEKPKTVNEKVCICQKCGNSWKID